MSSDDLPDVEISSFVAPTPEDLARLESLSRAQRKALIAREVQKGIDSGVSAMTMEDVWSEAMLRVANA